MFLANIFQAREINKIYVSKSLRAVALSLISIYIPIYLLSLGYSLIETILFYAVYHFVGLILVFIILIPYINKFGLTNTIKLHYPLLILFFILLNILPDYPISIYLIAIIGGLANFAYYVPINILFLKNTEKEKVGRDLSMLFALPKIFAILGPLLSALLIPFFGFGPIFILSSCILVLSFFPLASIKHRLTSVNIKIRKIFSKMKERKSLFFLEALDNILEESEWFWGIFIFLIIGSISLPGFVGSLQSVGGVLFILLIGKHADKNYFKMIIFSGIAMIGIWLSMMFASTWLAAFSISVAISFTMSAFLVSYTSMIYKKVKNDNEEEFLVLREIPTVLGRLAVFGFAILCLNNLSYFFLLPIFISILLLIIVFLKRFKLNN